MYSRQCNYNLRTCFDSIIFKFSPTNNNNFCSEDEVAKQLNMTKEELAALIDDLTKSAHTISSLRALPHDRFIAYVNRNFSEVLHLYPLIPMVNTAPPMPLQSSNMFYAQNMIFPPANIVPNNTPNIIPNSAPDISVSNTQTLKRKGTQFINETPKRRKNTTATSQPSGSRQGESSNSQEVINVEDDTPSAPSNFNSWKFNVIRFDNETPKPRGKRSEKKSSEATTAQEDVRRIPVDQTQNSNLLTTAQEDVRRIPVDQTQNSDLLTTAPRIFIGSELDDYLTKRVYVTMELLYHFNLLIPNQEKFALKYFNTAVSLIRPIISALKKCNAILDKKLFVDCDYNPNYKGAVDESFYQFEEDTSNLFNLIFEDLPEVKNAYIKYCLSDNKMPFLQSNEIKEINLQPFHSQKELSQHVKNKIKELKEYFKNIPVERGGIIKTLTPKDLNFRIIRSLLVSAYKKETLHIVQVPNLFDNTLRNTPENQVKKSIMNAVPNLKYKGLVSIPSRLGKKCICLPQDFSLELINIHFAHFVLPTTTNKKTLIDLLTSPDEEDVFGQDAFFKTCQKDNPSLEKSFKKFIDHLKANNLQSWYLQQNSPQNSSQASASSANNIAESRVDSARVSEVQHAEVYSEGSLTDLMLDFDVDSLLNSYNSPMPSQERQVFSSRDTSNPTEIYQASHSRMFQTSPEPSDETTPNQVFVPRFNQNSEE